MTSLRAAVRRSLSLSKFLMDFGSSECRPYTQVVAAVSYVISPTAHHPSARPSTALEVLTQAANARQEPFVCQRSDSVSLELATGIKAVKRSGVVSVFISIAVKSGERWTKRATLPGGFRPHASAISKAHLTDQPGAFVQIDPSGGVYTSSLATAGTLYAVVTFVVK